jgi:glycosyltransferase involved in cell wall biosynthesis
MKCPTQILFIASRSDIAGGENYLLSVMRHLDRERYRPLVVLPGHGEFGKALDRVGVETVVLESPSGFLRPAAPWYRLVMGLDERVGRIADIIRTRNVEIVHTNSNMRLEGALAARMLGIHHVYLAHIEFQPNLPIFERFPISQDSFAQLMGDLSTRVVAVSQSVASALIPPVAPEKVTVIHNGLDLETFDSAMASANGNLRHELGLSNDAILVASIGRVHPDKGNDFLVQVASQVTRQAENVHFVHAGGDDDKVFADKLRSEVKTLALNGQFHFLGFRQDVPRILAESDIFVLSSRREGHPFVLLEAMASGCAPVATRCGGVEDTVVPEKTGMLVDIGDTVGMTQAVMTLVRDANLRAAIAAAARADVRARFDAKRCVTALMDVYDVVLKAPRSVVGSIAIDMFLRAAHEIGTLGSKVTEMEERLRQVEHLAQSVRQNPLYRVARHVKQWFRAPSGEM